MHLWMDLRGKRNCVDNGLIELRLTCNKWRKVIGNHPLKTGISTSMIHFLQKWTAWRKNKIAQLGIFCRVEKIQKIAAK